MRTTIVRGNSDLCYGLQLRKVCLVQTPMTLKDHFVSLKAIVFCSCRYNTHSRGLCVGRMTITPFAIPFRLNELYYFSDAAFV
jgi:hypothetical protein